MNYRVPKRTILQLITANLCLLFAQYKTILQDYYFVTGLAILAWAAVEILFVRFGLYRHINKFQSLTSQIYPAIKTTAHITKTYMHRGIREVYDLFTTTVAKIPSVATQLKSTYQKLVSKLKRPKASTAIKISTHTQPIVAQTVDEVEIPRGFWSSIIAWADSPAWMVVIVVEILLMGFFYLSLQRFLDAHTGFEMFLVWHGL